MLSFLLFKRGIERQQQYVVPDIAEPEDRFEEITENDSNDSTINPAEFMENEMQIMGEVQRNFEILINSNLCLFTVYLQSRNQTVSARQHIAPSAN